MRISSKIALLAFVTVVLFTACVKKENIPATPVLTFNSFTQYLSGNADSAVMQVNFTDGNGNIGYLGNPADAQPNFFIFQLWDSSNHWVPFYGDTGASTFSYKIPNLTPSGSNKSLTGIIKIRMIPYLAPNIKSLSHGDTIKFNVWLFDRDGVKSNVLTTPTFYIP